MPNRYVREGINSSRAVATLTGDEERFYRRMIHVVDDFGRFELDPKLIRSQAFPVHDNIREADILRWVAACAKPELLVVYEVNGRQYLVLTKTEAPRARNSKYPNPPIQVVERYGLFTCANSCSHMKTFAPSSYSTPNPNPTPNTTKKLKSDKGGEKALAKLTFAQKTVADRFESALSEQWVNDAGKWVNRIRADLGKCDRVVAEVESAIKEGRINTTPAQYAEQIWKEFA